MTDTLAEICRRKREHVIARKQAVPEKALRSQVADSPPTRGFAHAIRKRVDRQETALIAEIKKASPSKGVIRADFDVPALARAYETAGAACLSVLTDAPYFHGDDSYVDAARHATALPVLRKDFIVDPYQIIESRAIGADCILLIMAALQDDQARECEALALSLELDVLIEVHDESELERALRHLKSPLIGVNNRNLKTLEVDVSISKRLLPMLPGDRIAICESGIASHADLQRMRALGIFAFLVGESLMRQDNVEDATRLLLGRNR